MARSVADAVRSPRAPRRDARREMVVWTQANVRRFLDAAAGHPLRPMLYTALMSGMRRGELLGLRWEDVDLECGSIHVRLNPAESDDGYKIGETKTPASNRVVAIAPDTVEVLRVHRAAQDAFARG